MSTQSGLPWLRFRDIAFLKPRMQPSSASTKNPQNHSTRKQACLPLSSSRSAARSMATPASIRPSPLPATSQPQPLSTVDFEALSYISRLVEAFQAFDSDGDGLVTAPELRGLLASLGLDKSEAEARDMLARADADRDGRLSVEELLDVMNAGELGLGALGALLQAAVPALESFAGPDGALGADDLARVLGLMGTASAEDCAEIIACMDGDGDGEISLEEFKLMADLL